LSELNLLPQQMMPAAIGNPPCISNPVVTAAVSQPLVVETKPMQSNSTVNRLICAASST
jgi:hypothetical protein